MKKMFWERKKLKRNEEGEKFLAKGLEFVKLNRRG
jgi:hypothetical protein